MDETEQTASLTRPRPGRVLVIAGRSGSGKTRLLRTLFRAWRSNSALPWPAAGMLGQNPATQFLTATVSEEVAFALNAARLPEPEIAARTAEALAAFELEARRDQPVAALSMGERCRVLLAALAALKAPALFLDEPFAQLDARGAALLARQIRVWAGRGCAVVVTAHDAAIPGGADDICALRADIGILPEAPGSAMLRPRIAEGESQVVAARDVSAVFPNGQAALNGISMTLGRGEFGVIAGRNGAGKTSFMRALVGDLPLSSGSLSILDASPPSVRGLSGRIGFVLQDPDLQIGGGTVREEVDGVIGDMARTDAVIGYCGLAALADSPSLRLSHGQKQALAFARAVAPLPPLLLLDEPFCGIDRAAADILAAGLRDLCRATGMSVLAVSHRPDGALDRVADVRMLMEEGRLRAV